MKKSKNRTWADFNSQANKILGHGKPNLEESIKHGLMFYYPEGLCPRGHQSARYTKTRRCRQCSLDENTVNNYKDEFIIKSENTSRKLKSKVDELSYSKEISKINASYEDYLFEGIDV